MGAEKKWGQIYFEFFLSTPREKVLAAGRASWNLRSDEITQAVKRTVSISINKDD